MANQKISQLNELTAPLSGDTLPIVNSGETKKISVSNLLTGSNIQPFFYATQTGSGQNFQVGDNVWLGDVGSTNTLLVKGVQDSGSGYIKFGDSGAHQHPYLGHDSNEEANVLSVNADTTKFSNSIIIGSGSLVSGNPEMIHVYSSGSYNIAYLVGDSDIYSQINIKNTASGETSSSDLVLTADNGNENELYINLGINSSNYSEVQNVGGQNDGYLIMNGQDLFIGSMNGGENHGHIHLFASSSFEDPQINILSNKQVGFNTSGITSGFTYEFSGSVKLANDLKVAGYVETSQIQATGSLNIQPDITDSRSVQIYNTDAGDIHIKGNAAYSFFGDDTNYVKIDSNDEKITINATSGTTINNLLKLNSILELPTSSSLGDMVVSGSNLYFHTDTSWMKVVLTTVVDPTPTPTATPTSTPTVTPTPVPTDTPTPTPTETETPVPTDTPTPTPTETPSPTSTPTLTPTPSPTPIPEFWIVNSNSTRTVTAIKYGAISEPLSLDGGSLPLGVGEVYRANHDINVDGNGMNTLQLDFGGTGFWSTFTILKNDVDAYGTALNGYAAGAVTLGGLAITPSDKIKIILT